MSHHDHTHHSHHHGQGSERRLIFSILFNLLISVTEIVGGMLSGSVALLSDALHNLSDTFSLVASFVGLRLDKRGKTSAMTFGYKRAQILIALLNSSLLLVTSLFLFKEALVHLLHPVVINGPLMIAVALVGLVANLSSVLLLKQDAQHSLNIRSAYMHLIMDTLSSVAVVVGAILVMLFKVYWIDGLFSILISGYVLLAGYKVLLEAIGILMHTSPKSIDVQVIEADILALEGVKDVHHIHVWNLTETQVHFEAHTKVEENLTMKEASQILCTIAKLLETKHHVSHSTIQLESGQCDGHKAGC